MQRVLLVILSICWLSVASATDTYQDDELARAATQYKDRIIQSGSTSPNLATALRRAVLYSRQGLWQEAIGEYEDMIAAGEDKPLIWLRLSEAWQGDRRTRNQRGHRQRALEAAYQAWSHSETDALRARALFRLGTLYQKSNRPRQAIAAWQAGLGLEENRDIAERYRRLSDSLSFRVKGVDVDSDGAEPRICLRFSHELPASTDFPYQDYVTIQPLVATAFKVNDTTLCLTGVSHGQQYQLTLRPGLKSAAGETISDVETFSAEVGDRAPTLGFRGSRYVLPRAGSQELPLTTVNVDKARIEVLRITDRNLVNRINERQIYDLISGSASRRIAERSGESVWQGELSIASRLNSEVTTAIPVRQLVSDPRPGVYIVTATDAELELDSWEERATQWLVISDLGLSTFKGDDGLHVFVRSLDSAKPLSGVRLRLYGRNNEEIGAAFSDAQGQVRFAPGLLRSSGGRTPTALMAFAVGGDFNFLDLTRAAFDLSDRGVAGRPAPGPLDAYLYSERGVYRPGETVELTTLLRDERGYSSSQALPITLSLIRPDQVEAERFTLQDIGLGGYHARIPLADNARTGTWQVKVYADPTAEPIGGLKFLVEDFVPQRLKLDLSSTQQALHPGQTLSVQVNGRFLYGAPAAQLRTDAELVLREDADPFPDYPGYRFGLVQEHWDSKRFPLESSPTDSNGHTELALQLDEHPDTTRPLKAVLRVSLFEPGGRPVNQVLGLPYPIRPFQIGVKPQFDGSVKLGQEAAFSIIALSPTGQAQQVTGLEAELVREDYEYYWYYEDNRWDYRLIIRDGEPISRRRIDLTGEEPYTLSQNGLDWGPYRLDIIDPTTGAASSVRFSVGWYAAPGSGDTPDKLRLTLDRPSYSAGDTAQVRVQAPFAGEVLLTVAGNTLWTSRNFSVSAEGTTIELPIDPAWSPGVYLTATAFRPAANGRQRGPGRAVGVTWLALDPSPRTLTINLDAPNEIRPRQTFELPVSVTGATPGEPVYLTVAAVDEGILQLTDFASPDPLQHYFGKRRLGIELYDLYGQLISSDGQLGQLRSGAGAGSRNRSGDGVKTVETVALFSGPVRLDSDGSARIPLAIPDFNGELRLMAVAWDAARFGQLDQPLLVRDPLLAEAYLPRFLAPGDRADLTLNLQSLNAPPGEYQVTLRSSGVVKLDNPAPARLIVLADSEPSRLQQHYSLRGIAPGVGRIRLQLDGPAGFQLTREYQISVRPSQTVVSSRQTQRLPAGEPLHLDGSLLAPYLPGTRDVRLRFSSRPGLNVPELLQRLDRYPYGCLEQTTSRALPLLYTGDVAQQWLVSLADGDALRQRVQDALQRVLAMQRYSGGFGLWNPDSATEYWLSAYAMDFLVRAKARDYLVPNNPYQRGLDWLREQLNDVGYEPKDLAFRAYALYVLARADQAPLSELRYLHDNQLQAIPSRLALAQLGAALARYGDRGRAMEAFTLAIDNKLTTAEEWHDYGTELRDRAALVTLLAEADIQAKQLPQLAEELTDAFAQRRYTSTQENSWLLLAAHALSENTGALALSVNRTAIPTELDPYYYSPSAAELARGSVVLNQGSAPIWYVVDSSGVPTTPQPSVQEGFSIDRRFYTREGEEIPLDQVLQNEMVVAVISGAAQTQDRHQALVVDLLPAGLELENARLGHGDSVADYAWLPELTATEHVEFRDDRFVAALDLGQNQRNFTVAYLARAVTPGDYTLPAVYVEDMYKPWYFARGPINRIQVR